MAGVTNRAFRLLVRELGAGMVGTEMVSARSLCHGNRRSRELIAICDAQRPVAVQFFGHEPDVLARAGKIAEDLGADVIDINLGCPTPKIVRNGDGAALMRQPHIVAEIVSAVANAVSIPVTVKMRKGWDEQSVNAVAIARLVVAAGAQAVTVHGRARSQFYTGQADWEIIRQVTDAVQIPVIGNGDVFTPQDAMRMLAETGCAGVMIARGALGNPWIFQQTAALLNGTPLTSPSCPERIAMAKRHLKLLCDDFPEAVAVRQMRKHASWYLKGFHDAAQARRLVNAACIREEMERALDWALAQQG